jgi:hypothetical protein
MLTGPAEGGKTWTSRQWAMRWSKKKKKKTTTKKKKKKS